MKILVGTSSWTDKSPLRPATSIPQREDREARVRFYASRFTIVEVDSSYYAIPDPQVAQLWAERTPPSFLFNVKAFRLLVNRSATWAESFGEYGSG